MNVSRCEPVGVLEVAARLGVKDRTVHQWLNRGLMPPDDFGVVNGSRAWNWPTILGWAGVSGRLHGNPLRAEFVAVFGHEAEPERWGGPQTGDPLAKLDVLLKVLALGPGTPLNGTGKSPSGKARRRAEKSAETFSADPPTTEAEVEAAVSSIGTPAPDVVSGAVS